eukprot:TRINITY_DN60587_c0_g1_i1.p1 TRINITY_DN60587_c0_g1~~TRINITY_DN60587_c0_g1_i1.p1  ORF type:complete len:1044 (+),score=236.26 TRINITY_DN60587_c0_g1_i1:102-3134(+)
MSSKGVMRRTPGRGQDAIKRPHDELVHRWAARLPSGHKLLRRSSVTREVADDGVPPEVARDMANRVAGLQLDGFNAEDMPDLAVQAKAAATLRRVRKRMADHQSQSAVGRRQPTPPPPLTGQQLAPRSPRGIQTVEQPPPVAGASTFTPTFTPVPPPKPPPAADAPPADAHSPAAGPGDRPTGRRHSRRSSTSTGIKPSAAVPRKYIQSARGGIFTHGPGDRRRVGMPKVTLREDIELTQARITRCMSGGGCEDIAALDDELHALLSTKRHGMLPPKAKRRAKPPPPPPRPATPNTLVVTAPGSTYEGLYHSDPTRERQWILGLNRVRRTRLGAWRVEQASHCYMEAAEPHERAPPWEPVQWDRWNGPTCDWIPEEGFCIVQKQLDREGEGAQAHGRRRTSSPERRPSIPTLVITGSKVGLDGEYTPCGLTLDDCPVWRCGTLQLASGEGYWRIDDYRYTCFETQFTPSMTANLKHPPEDGPWDKWDGEKLCWQPVEGVSVRRPDAAGGAPPLPLLTPPTNAVSSEKDIATGQRNVTWFKQGSPRGGGAAPTPPISSSGGGAATFLTNLPIGAFDEMQQEEKARQAQRAAPKRLSTASARRTSRRGTRRGSTSPTGRGSPRSPLRASPTSESAAEDGPSFASSLRMPPSEVAPPTTSTELLIAHLPPVRLKHVSVHDVRSGKLMRAIERADYLADALRENDEDEDIEASRMVETLLFGFHSGMKINEARRVLGLTYRFDDSKSYAETAEDFPSFARAYCWERLQFHARCTRELHRMAKERRVLFPKKRNILDGILENSEEARRRNPRWRRAREKLHNQVFQDVKAEFRLRRRHLLKLWIEQFKRALPPVLTQGCREVMHQLDKVFATGVPLDQRAFWTVVQNSLTGPSYLLDDVISLLWAIKRVFQVSDEDFCEHVRKSTLGMWAPPIDFRLPRPPQVEKKTYGTSAHPVITQTAVSAPSAPKTAEGGAEPSPPLVLPPCGGTAHRKQSSSVGGTHAVSLGRPQSSWFGA